MPDSQWSLEAERSVLGVILVHPEVIVDVAPPLTPADFYRHAHQRIFWRMLDLDHHGEPIDLVSLREALRMHGELDDVGGPAYISSLADGVPRSANVQYYARVVRDKAALRQVMAAARKAIAAGDSHDANWTEIVETLEQDLYGLTARVRPSDWTSGADLAALLRQDIADRIANRGQTRGLPYGFADLDAITDGLQRQDLVIVAGRPSMGKSAFLTPVCLHAAARGHVAAFSLEMSRATWGLRAITFDAPVDGWKLMTGSISERDRRAVDESLHRLEASGVHVDDNPHRTPLELRSRLRQLQARVGPLSLVAIDYLQLLLPLPEHRRENKQNQVAGISRALKLLAREFDAPFLVLSQLNRGPELTADHQPKLSDLRDSGAIEQDADVVLLLHRPEYYATADDERAKDAGLAEVIIAKQRNGATGLVRLAWLAEQMRFASLSSCNKPTLVRR